MRCFVLSSEVWLLFLFFFFFFSVCLYLLFDSLIPWCYKRSSSYLQEWWETKALQLSNVLCACLIGSLMFDIHPIKSCLSIHLFLSVFTPILLFPASIYHSVFPYGVLPVWYLAVRMGCREGEELWRACEWVDCIFEGITCTGYCLPGPHDWKTSLPWLLSLLKQAEACKYKTTKQYSWTPALNPDVYRLCRVKMLSSSLIWF